MYSKMRSVIPPLLEKLDKKPTIPNIIFMLREILRVPKESEQKLRIEEMRCLAVASIWGNNNVTQKGVEKYV